MSGAIVENDRQGRFVLIFTSPPGESNGFAELLEALSQDYGQTLAIAYESATRGDPCSLELTDDGSSVEHVRWRDGRAPSRARIVAMVETRLRSQGEDDDCAGGACAL